VLPFYVLHEPVIVVIAYWLVRWEVGIVPKYLALVVASFVGTLVLYEFCVRRFRVARFLLGMKRPPIGGWAPCTDPDRRSRPTKEEAENVRPWWRRRRRSPATGFPRR
jgi:peptidoglycan/LPS O-acetylase OafA/YrhL